MTPSQAKRAVFLLKAKECLQGELTPDAEAWKDEEIVPFALKKEGDLVGLCQRNSDDDILSIATIDRELGLKMCGYLISEIDAELKELGVTE